MERHFLKFFLFSLVALTLVPGISSAQQQQQSAQGGGADADAAVGSIQTGADDGSYSGADPFAELEQMQMRMMEMLRGVMASDFFQPSSSGFAGQMLRPDYDMLEMKDAYVIHMDAPGMRKDRIDIQVKDDTLLVSAERETVEERTEEREGSSYTFRGRSLGALKRNLKIPENVNVEAISAKYDNGVLTITLPKTAEKAEEPRKIQVS